MTSHAEPARLVSKAAPPDLVAEFVQGALAARRAEGTLIVVTVPAPTAPLEALFEYAPGEDAVLWDPPDGAGFAGIGAAVVVEGAGASRFEDVTARAATLWPLLELHTLGDEAPPPRLFGGFAFNAGAAAAAPWEPFGDARFVLPRIRYARTAESAFVSLCVRAEQASTAEAQKRLVADVESVLQALRAAASRNGVRAAGEPRTVLAEAGMSEVEWKDLVESIRARIVGGDFEKVVAARKTTLTFAGAIDAADVLAELAASQPSCTRFAFRVSGVTFLGASPERLVRRSGLSIDTEALAGSNRIGDAGRLELLASTKERAEHEPVLREIVRHLSPLCETLEYPDAPEVRTLRHLLHLRTPVRGRLKEPIHVVSLVSRLHPTPAVGGFPAAEAVRFIVDHEPDARGWYASPVGSFDDAGNGEFAVGLRSGVIGGAGCGGRSISLYAGGGIVQDSDPASEFVETRLKLKALLAALRVAPSRDAPSTDE
jgi:isochorismate synthase